MKSGNGWKPRGPGLEAESALEPSAVLNLHRITSEYIATEDRFRLSGTTDKGVAVSYWITQRLLLRVLHVLLDWLGSHREELERQAAAEMLGPMAARPVPAEAQPGAETRGEATGGAAAGEETAPPSDDTPAGDTAELLFEADIRIAPNRITLVFKPRSSEHAQLSLQLGEAWQWVAIIHTLWKRAEWNQAVWPDWIEQVKAPHPEKAWGSLH